MTNLYDYPITFAIKIIVRKGNQILLLREPESNEWMPGRLGLPGGKLFQGETIEEGVKRKIKTEIGFEVTIRGLVSLVDIIMPDKTVYMLVLAAEHVSGEIDTTHTESHEMRWYDADHIAQLSNDDCAEYYLPQLLNAYLSDSLPIVPTSFLQIQDNRTPKILEWMNKGTNRPQP